MPSLDDLADPNYRVKKGPSCGMAMLLDQLDKQTAETLRKALANPHAGSTTIVETLRSMGHNIGLYTLQRHRRGHCRCGETA